MVDFNSISPEHDKFNCFTKTSCLYDSKLNFIVLGQFSQMQKAMLEQQQQLNLEQIMGEAERARRLEVEQQLKVAAEHNRRVLKSKNAMNKQRYILASVIFLLLFYITYYKVDN